MDQKNQEENSKFVLYMIILSVFRKMAWPGLGLEGRGIFVRGVIGLEKKR